jgi:hypothetical protein
MNRKESRAHAVKLRRAKKLWDKKTARTDTCVVSYVDVDNVRYRFQTGMHAERVGSVEEHTESTDWKTAAKRWWARLRKGK